MGGEDEPTTGLTTVGQRVIDAVNQAISEGLTAQSCWHWIEAVFKKAGLYPDGVPFYKAFEYIFQGSQYDAASSVMFLPKSRYASLITGDWLYVHNQNKYDRNGNHSVIFMGWEDQPTAQARVASSPFAHKPGHIETRNLVEQPIAFIMRARG